jgi:hypothetical protein
MALRVQALWNHSRPIKIMVLLLFLVNIMAPIIIVCQMYATAILVPATPPFTGCSTIITSTNLTYVISIPSFVYETIVIVLTVTKSYPLLRQGPITLPLSNLLFNDGLIFYCAIVAAQLLVIICSYSGNTSLIISVAATGLVLPVSAVACNRLLLRLQSALISQDVMSLDPKSSITNASIGMWNLPVATNDSGTGASDFDRGRGRRRQEQLATNWTAIVMADLVEHQLQSPSQAPGREPRRSEEGAEHGVAH